MTEIVLFKNADHKIIGFECLGHSGFARRGKDLVCASISVLTINTVNSLEKIAGVKTEVRAEDKAGHLYCKLLDEPTIQTNTLFEALELGLNGIYENYGSKYCKVTYKEEKSC